MNKRINPAKNPSEEHVDISAREAGYKRRFRRIFVTGAALVAAVAGSVALVGCDQAGSTGTDAPSAEASAPNSAADETTATTSTDPDTDKIQAYEDAEAYTDGLSVSEFANSCGFDTLSEAYAYWEDDIPSRLQYEMSKMGYHTNGYEMVTNPQGELFASIAASFTPDNGIAKLVGVGVEAYIDRNAFTIRIHGVPNNDVRTEYDTDTIPTPDEAAQILADNS